MTPPPNATKRNAAVELRDALRTAEASQRGYLLTDNEIYLAPYDTAKALAQRQLTALNRDMAGLEQAAPMLRRLTTVVGDKIDEMDQTIGLKRGGRDADALAAIRTNRGKALMDEANVFLYGIILSADERLTAGGVEQQRNATMLRWAAIIAAFVIIVVVGGVTITVLMYAREIAQARDEVRRMNSSLEERVERRTADLALARERAEMLLAEVNHRVANSLQLVASLVKLQSNAVADSAAKDALAENPGPHLRHRAGPQEPVQFRRRAFRGARRISARPARPYRNLDARRRPHGVRCATTSSRCGYVPTPASALGVVVTEWVTNAFKYAYPDHPGEIRVRLTRTAAGTAELVVEDDGIGRSDAPQAQGTGLGTRIVNVMAATIKAQIDYLKRQPGTAARLIFPAAAD